MGVVYKARDPFIGRMVALKTITPELVSDPEILKRFYREAQSAGTLQHPNIVTIYDLGEADGRPYIAMEFVEGESLQSIINRRARIPLAAKLKLVQQFCEGLGHAHKHGFVHRDVKPANILVTERRQREGGGFRHRPLGIHQPHQDRNVPGDHSLSNT